MRAAPRLAALALGALGLLPPAASAHPEWLILVRHAEKDAEPADDPGLTPDGQARAQDLAAALRGVEIRRIVTSDRRRTQDTAAPLARMLGLVPQIVGGRQAAHVEALVDAVRAQEGGAMLVVGHANTVPALVAALGGPRLPAWCETQHASMWVLKMPEAQLLPLHYGRADPPAASACR